MAEVHVDDGLFGTWTDHDGWRRQAEHMASFEKRQTRPSVALVASS
jgi:hypothetical protein